MKGSFHFRVSGKRAVFDFTIRRNITVIKGDSATGKTTLLRMLYEYLRVGRESGYSVAASVPYYVYLRKEVGRSWEEALDSVKDSVIFIEENNDFVFSKKFAEYVKTSGNYFVFVNRTPLHMLPYSIHEIYEIVTSSKNKNIKEAYHEFKELYSNFPETKDNKIETVVTEDSNSGLDFFKAYYINAEVWSCGGNTNVCRTLDTIEARDVLVIVDGAAYGAYIEESIAAISSRDDIRISLWMPESFEYLILQSGIIRDEQINRILDDVSFFVDSREYESWEQFFTDLLENTTKQGEYPYNKRHLHPFYLREDSINIISNRFPDGVKYE